MVSRKDIYWFAVFFAILHFTVVGSESGSGSGSYTQCSPLSPMHLCYALPGRHSMHSLQVISPDATVPSKEMMNVTLLFQDSLNSSAPEECIELLHYFGCLLTMPPCDSTSLHPLQVCSKACDAFSSIFYNKSPCYAYIHERSTVLRGNGFSELFEVILESFNCSDPNTYSFQNETDYESSKCTSLLDPDTQDKVLNSTKRTSCQMRPKESVCKKTTGNYFVSMDERLLMEPIALRVLSKLRKSLENQCSDVVMDLACYYFYPPCNTQKGTQIPLCDELCSQLNSTLVHCQAQLEAALSSNLSAPMFELLEHILQLNCADPLSYLIPHVLVDTKECVSLKEQIITSNQDSKFFTKRVLIIAVCVLAGLLLVCMLSASLVACCIWRRKDEYRSKDEWTSQSSVSTLRRLDSPNPLTTDILAVDREELNEVQIARTLTDRKRRQYVSLYMGYFIPYRDLKLQELIGEGAYGKVCEGTWRDASSQTEIRVAVKTLKSFSSRQHLETLFAEGRLLRDLDHPNVMKFLGMCFDAPEGFPYIILPFMANGSLKDYFKKDQFNTHRNSLKNRERMELPILNQFCLDIAEGMNYLAQRKFVHRDLAARNCMVNEAECVVIGDFGLARAACTPASSPTTSTNHSRVNGCGVHTGREARLPVKWMAPEALHNGVSNEKTDVWSYGVTCWEVFSLGRTPYPGIENHEILDYITGGGRLKKPYLCSERMFNIMSSCWDLSQAHRPSFQELVSIVVKLNKGML